MIVLGIFLISAISAICCERTEIKSDDGTGGAWCVDATAEVECETGDCGEDKDGNKLTCRKVPTSCEATSYCSLGCCYDSQDGTCMENTPENVCSSGGGVWDSSSDCSIPQCELGCCLIGDQAAFVTQTRCKSLSADYGLETNFRTDISSEIECIASAMPDVKGACVYEEDYAKTCQFLTKKECSELSVEDATEFHRNYLCSAPDLATNCGPRGGTTCVEGKDEVYFVDTCGNLANVYDFGKWNKPVYWTYVAGTNGVEVGCRESDGTLNPKTCGDCDYYLGSTCKAYKSGETAKPDKGDYVCKDLSCEYDGEQYSHGETWCATIVGDSEKKSEIIVSEDWNPSIYNKPGSRYFRLVCYNGDVTVEPCADFRQEVCLQSDVGGFSAAACRVNMWQDCVSQDNEQDCVNIDRRDCKWEEDFCILKDEDGKCLAKDKNGNEVKSSCAPNYAPGFDFWNTEGDAESACSLASTMCVVTYKRGYEGVFEKEDWKVKGEKTCLDDDKNVIPSWEANMNEMCMNLGDCGSSINYLEVQGYHEGSAVSIE